MRVWAGRGFILPPLGSGMTKCAKRHASMPRSGDLTGLPGASEEHDEATGDRVLEAEHGLGIVELVQDGGVLEKG